MWCSEKDIFKPNMGMYVRGMRQLICMVPSLVTRASFHSWVRHLEVALRATVGRGSDYSHLLKQVGYTVCLGTAFLKNKLNN